jgi:hypothetical protein
MEISRSRLLFSGEKVFMIEKMWILSGAKVFDIFIENDGFLSNT